MSRVPRPNRAVTDPEQTARRAEAAQLLDMTRQWAYSRVMRRANLNRHLDTCVKCRPRDEQGRPLKNCRERDRLGAMVAECYNELAALREQLAELDRPDPDPVAASAATMF